MAEYPREFYPLAFVATAAAFSPNPNRAPLYVDFPYQERDGRSEKNDAVLEKWRSKMSVYMVEEKATRSASGWRPGCLNFSQKDWSSPTQTDPTP